MGRTSLSLGGAGRIVNEPAQRRNEYSTTRQAGVCSEFRTFLRKRLLSNCRHNSMSAFPLWAPEQTLERILCLVVTGVPYSP